jgi:hypothetical protein
MKEVMHLLLVSQNWAGLKKNVKNFGNKPEKQTRLCFWEKAITKRTTVFTECKIIITVTIK